MSADPYRFAPSESIRKEFARIGSDLIDGMRLDVECLDAASIHCARRRCKMLRALLRLAHDALDSAAARIVQLRIRRLARSLSGARDATVRLTTFRTLAAKGFGTLDRSLAVEAATEQHKHFTAEARLHAQHAVDLIAKGFTDLDLRKVGKRAVLAGLRRSYREARAAFRRIEPHPQDEALHRWRKRAKDFMYHVRLLCKIRPRKMKQREKQLDDLTDWLGLDHDLIVLTAYLRKHEDLSEQDRDAIETLIVKRRKEHLAAARYLAESLFHDRPGEFLKRVSG